MNNIGITSAPHTDNSSYADQARRGSDVVSSDVGCAASAEWKSSDSLYSEPVSHGRDTYEPANSSYQVSDCIVALNNRGLHVLSHANLLDKDEGTSCGLFTEVRLLWVCDK
jgi:hypothetical protein